MKLRWALSCCLGFASVTCGSKHDETVSKVSVVDTATPTGSETPSPTTPTDAGPPDAIADARTESSGPTPLPACGERQPPAVEFVMPQPDGALPYDYHGRGVVNSIDDLSMIVTLGAAESSAGRLSIQRANFPDLASPGDELEVQVLRFGGEDMALLIRTVDGQLLLFSYVGPYRDEAVLAFELPFAIELVPNCSADVGDCSIQVLEVRLTIRDNTMSVVPPSVAEIELGGEAVDAYAQLAEEFGMNCMGSDLPGPGRRLALQVLPAEYR